MVKRKSKNTSIKQPAIRKARNEGNTTPSNYTLRLKNNSYMHTFLAIIYIFGVFVIGFLSSILIYDPAKRPLGSFLYSCILTLGWPITIPIWLIWLLFQR